MRRALLWSVALVLPFAVQAQPDRKGTLIDKTTGVPIGKTIEGLLVDNAAASVSAATLVGVDADTVDVVENVRDFSLLLKGFDKDAKAFGLAITPARTATPFPSIRLADYRDHLGLRLLGSLTFSYAQGTAELAGKDHERRAVSVQTSAFWNPGEDPVVAVAESDECGQRALDALGDDPPALTDEQARTLAAEPQKLQDAARSGDRGARRAVRASARVDSELEKKMLAAYDACAAEVLDTLAKKWNRTRYSIAYGTGWVRPTDHGASRRSLGHAVSASFLYGFDMGQKDAPFLGAVTLRARVGRREPVLDTLADAEVALRNSTLLAARLSGGSASFRGLLEVSNARSHDVTTTQRTFKRALGIDYRVMDGLWLNLRLGRQRKLDGTGDETGSFLLLNYSPSAMLGP